MIKSVIVIGVGSLGGFVVSALSDLDEIEKIAIIDFDVVEYKNLENSIYSREHIGQYKINCLEEIINKKRNDIKIEKYNSKYVEKKTVLPQGYDLILDCRDYTYDRYQEIDCRLYISSRYLILDCRNDIKYEKAYKGKYISKLKKTDLRNASIILSSLIDNNIIKDLIDGDSTTKFDLDYYKRDLSFKEDLIYDCDKSIEKLETSISNLPSQIAPIVEKNKTESLNVCFGGDKHVKEITKNEIQNIEDLSKYLQCFINEKNEMTCSFNNYIIYLNDNNIELIPDTGAA